jgi:hypothetical protein
MQSSILASLGKIAGVAGIALGVFLLLFQGVLEIEKRPKPGSVQHRLLLSYFH